MARSDPNLFDDSARNTALGDGAIAHGGRGASLALLHGLDPSSIIDLSASLNPFAPDIGEIAGKHLDHLATNPTLGTPPHY